MNIINYRSGVVHGIDNDKTDCGERVEVLLSKKGEYSESSISCNKCLEARLSRISQSANEA